jgi:hypothetical protein
MSILYEVFVECLGESENSIAIDIDRSVVVVYFLPLTWQRNVKSK